MGKEIDHEYTDHPVFPYCGKVHDDIDEPWSGNSQCWECEKHFFCEPIYSVNYSTKQVPCWNGVPHVMVKDPWWPDKPNEQVPWNCNVCREKTEWRDQEVKESP